MVCLSGVPVPLLSPFFSAFSAFGALSECAVCNRLAVDTVQERLTRGGGVRTSTRRGPLRRLRPVGAIDEPRSARPMDTSSTSQGSLRAGEGMDGGAVDRHAGVLSGFCAPRAKIGYPSTTLTIGCGRHISGPPRIWAEVRPQGVPQTGKIIEVKRRLSGSFFSIPEGLAVLFWVVWLGLMSQERW